jgi:hypothetical protein
VISGRTPQRISPVKNVVQRRYLFTSFVLRNAREENREEYRTDRLVCSIGKGCLYVDFLLDFF